MSLWEFASEPYKFQQHGIALNLLQSSPGPAYGVGPLFTLEEGGHRCQEAERIVMVNFTRVFLDVPFATHMLNEALFSRCSVKITEVRKC